ncbi:serine-type D-Ala-D-Ala carboxypeptidase [Legionella birminghamensis]|uniref:Serine-type D-Ala-D-Ala carboxypeptidase n=1 Tax=Legionella birminghamensis TaxID=28083 RepID=A0A378IA23_9GAMM|nr:serine hydrolase domain-containing protein [Legionella birminghamensis]KTC75156.1 serine-type D-Ala-D-Ala carboxypeptidase [Legionella birminghamensis]STX31893.1 serine-type D-Ala-D-Ala carboxypeptidase [Legionella birminghamensis]
MLKKQQIIFFFSFFLAFTVFSRGTIESQLQAILNKDLDASTPGAVLLVSSPETGLMIVAAGQSNQQTRQSMHTDNNFRIGSISKTFLAVVVLKLIEENKLSLDSKISTLLPNTVDINRIPNGQQLTVRNLLQMRSGIPNYVEYESYYRLIENMVGHQWKPEMLIELVYDKKPKFPPDSSYEYSNTNYLLLQLIVEKLTGHSYADVIKERILIPLEMKGTYVEQNDADTLGLSTRGYTLAEKQLIDVTYLNDGFGLGDSGMISTVTDLHRFVAALLQEKTLLSSASLKEMLSTKDDYGLGIYREQIGDEWAWTHNGATSGFQGEYYYFPREKLIIVVLTNFFDTEIIDKIVYDSFQLFSRQR